MMLKDLAISDIFRTFAKNIRKTYGKLVLEM